MVDCPFPENTIAGLRNAAARVAVPEARQKRVLQDDMIEQKCSKDSLSIKSSKLLIG